jgi:hypothetical protein
VSESPRRVFLLSPANASGERAALLLRDQAQFELARRLRSREGAPLGAIYSFVSGLYFRGKLTYATRFAPDSVFVIVPGAGLVSPATPVRRRDMLRYARVPVSPAEPKYRRPFLRDVRRLARDANPETTVVLLGSIATDKYCSVLLEVFGARLLFPSDFVGRGDMSRGGLLLRAAYDGRELPYAPVAGAVRHGPRPAKLDPKTRARE